MTDEQNKRCKAAMINNLSGFISTDEMLVFFEGYAAGLVDIDLIKERDELKSALAKLADTVDDSLLLDEDLHHDWGVLRAAVVVAREALETK